MRDFNRTSRLGWSLARETTPGLRAFLVGVLLLGSAPFALALTPGELLDRYWAKRQNFLSHHVRIGDGAGRSLVAEYFTDTGRLNFADQTITLGWYLAVLATESRLLDEAGSDTSANRLELAYALRAVDRLDSRAEATFRGGVPRPEDVNGYFLRDDASTPLLGLFPGMTRLSSDWMIGGRTNEMSQDQVIGLLFGLRAASRFLRPTDPLRAQAVAQADRITRHVCCGGPDSWRIINPVTRARVARGDDATVLSAGIVLAARAAGVTAPLRSPAWYSRAAIEMAAAVPAPQFFNRAMLLQLGTAGNIWSGSTAEVLRRYDVAFSKPLYPLLHALYQGSRSEDGRLGEHAARLIEAPEIQTNASTTAWSCFNRFYADCTPAQQPPPEIEAYAGIDFMLYANAYALYAFRPEERRSWSMPDAIKSLIRRQARIGAPKYLKAEATD